MSDFAIQFDKNSFSLVNSEPLSAPSIPPGGSASVHVKLSNTGQLQRQDPLNKLNIAFKATGLPSVVYFVAHVPFHALLTEDGQMEKPAYLEQWKTITEEHNTSLSGVHLSAAELIDKLTQNNVFSVAKRSVNGQDVCYVSFKFINGLSVLAELTLQGNGNVGVAVKAAQPAVITCAQDALATLLQPAAAADPMAGLF